MPTPNADETKSDFMDRCPSIVIDDGTTDDHEQAVAVCESTWADRERVNPMDSLKRMWDDLWAGIEVVLGLKRVPQSEPKERALALGRMFERTRMAIDAAHPQEWIFIHDIFQDGDAWFAIGSSGGNLYQYPLTVTEESVTVGERIQVVEEFRPVAERTIITRLDDGRYRWLSVSATALVNKVGEIDGTELFDDFERQTLEDDYEWPYRCFFHLGEQYRTGQVDFVARWEYGLITSGLYDDTVLGRTEAEARMANPDAWRDSIHFQPGAAPDVIEVQDIKIPVHRAGTLVEVTTAPAGDVCSYGTTQTMIQEVNRMEKGSRVHEAFLKLFSGDEEAAGAWLDENPGAATRAVEDGAVARTEDAQPPQDDPPAPAPVEREVAVDDELVGIIADQVLVSLTDGPLAQITVTLEELARKMDSAATEAERAVRETGERFAVLERDDEQRTEIIRQDMPRREIIQVGYRPRVDQAPQNNGPADLSAQAADTLSRLPLR